MVVAVQLVVVVVAAAAAAVNPYRMTGATVDRLNNDDDDGDGGMWVQATNTAVFVSSLTCRMIYCRLRPCVGTSHSEAVG